MNKKIYVKQECVEWLTEIYFNKEEHYFTLEIKFSKKELEIISQSKEYQNILLIFLNLEFNKSRNIIQAVVYIMQKELPYIIKYEVSEKQMVLKWLYEHYFR